MGNVFTVETDNHGADILTGGDSDHRLLRCLGQLIEHGVDLGVDFRKRDVRIIVKTHVRGDGANALRARRCEIVDAVGLGDGVFQRRSDKAGHQFRVGSGIDGGDS